VTTDTTDRRHELLAKLDRARKARDIINTPLDRIVIDDFIRQTEREIQELDREDRTTA
jgi:hypothetical protein